MAWIHSKSGVRKVKAGYKGKYRKFRTKAGAKRAKKRVK